MTILMTIMEWLVHNTLIDYPEALQVMEARVYDVAHARTPELCWLVEHSPLYTAGTSAKAHDLLQASFPVYESGRGGQYTYHGPGQRIVYTMVNLKKRYAPDLPDIRHFVHTLEEWIIKALAECGITGERRNGRIGIWVVHQGRESKIAALGIRIRSGVSFHGIAINHSPDLTHYQGIVPCGISDYGVTSLRALGVECSMSTLDAALKKHCPFFAT